MAKRAANEWIGGVVPLPGYVAGEGEGEPYRPEALLWLSPEGAVVGTEVLKPGESVAKASACLRNAMERPMWGPPSTPNRVRVASPELAAAVRQGHPGLEVVCAPTPELQDVADSMREHFLEEEGDPPSYLDAGVSPEAVAAFFRAAAGLYRAKPWTVVPDDDAIAVTIDALGLREAALTVIGHLGESFGFLLFEDGVAGLDAFADAALAFEAGESRQMPRHLALNFERGGDLEASLRKEIAEHGWEVPSPAAHPWVFVVEEDLVSRSVTARELRAVEALALALPKFLEARAALEEAWVGGEPVEQKLRVATHAGELEVVLRAPMESGAEDDFAEPGFIDALIEVGRAEGFDVDSVSGLKAWLREAESRAAVSMPPAAAQPRRGSKPAAKRKKKQGAQPKAAKKARNRRR